MPAPALLPRSVVETEKKKRREEEERMKRWDVVIVWAIQSCVY